MSLSAIMDGIQQLMLPVLFREGDEKVNVNDQPPRVVWFPTADQYGAARLQGAAEPRAVGTRVAGVEFHVWGADLASTEVLANSLAAAIYAQSFGSSSIRGGQFRPHGATDQGRLYVLNATFDIPVTMPPIRLITLGSAPQDVEIQDS